MLTDQQTKYFYELTPDKVLEGVERFGVRCTGRVLQLNSMENRVFEVEIEVDDDQVKTPADRFRVVKFYRPGRWTIDQIQEEHKFLLDLEKAEVPVVAPVKTEQGETVLELPEVGIWSALYPKVGGRIPDEFSDEGYRQLGRLLARLHTVGAKSQAEHRIRLTPAVYGIANLKFLIDSKIVPADLAPAYRSTVEAICSMIEPWFETRMYSRIHGDCHIGNVLQRGEYYFLVDFDDMVIGPPVQDLWLLLPGRDQAARNKLEQMLSGYELFREFDRSTIRLIEPLRALRLIHYTAWIAKRWSDPAFPRAFPHFNTPNYWNQHLNDLREQLQIISEGGFAAAEY